MFPGGIHSGRANRTAAAETRTGPDREILHVFFCSDTGDFETVEFGPPAARAPTVDIDIFTSAWLLPYRNVSSHSGRA